MVFTQEDRIAIKFLRENKKYGAKRFLKEFPNKKWSHTGLSKLLRKIDKTGSVDRQKGSGRKRTARTDDKIALVDQRVLSEEGKPQTHSSQREIAREIGISQQSVHRIIKQDLNLKCLKKRRATLLTDVNKKARLERSQQLLRLRSLPSLSNSLKTPKRGSSKRDEAGWKEVVRKTGSLSVRSKKVLVPSNAISRVIGRGGCNINTIREVSGAAIEVEKQKGAGDRAIVIRGSAESTKTAHQLITQMIKDPDRDLRDLLPGKSAAANSKSSLQHQHQQQQNAGSSLGVHSRINPNSSCSSEMLVASVTGGNQNQQQHPNNMSQQQQMHMNRLSGMHENQEYQHHQQQKHSQHQQSVNIPNFSGPGVPNLVGMVSSTPHHPGLEYLEPHTDVNGVGRIQIGNHCRVSGSDIEEECPLY